MRRPAHARRRVALLQGPGRSRHKGSRRSCSVHPPRSARSEVVPVSEKLKTARGFFAHSDSVLGFDDFGLCLKGGKRGKRGITRGKSEALPGSWWRASPIRFPAHLLLPSSPQTLTSQAQLQTEHDSARGFLLWAEVARCWVSLHPSFLPSLFRPDATSPSIALSLLFEPPT